MFEDCKLDYLAQDGKCVYNGEKIATYINSYINLEEIGIDEYYSISDFLEDNWIENYMLARESLDNLVVRSNCNPWEL